MAGIDLPESSSLDGDSLAPLITGEVDNGPDRKFIVQYGGRHRPTKYGESTIVWNQWRLVEGEELYDLSSDPGQESDIAAEHPEIVQEMQAHYDEYWAEIEASVEVVEPLFIRAEQGTFTDLTSNSWIEVDCDNRERTANACGPPRGGVWQIETEQSGQYSVELSRWPFHLDRDMTVVGPGATIGGMLIERGVALPIASASLSLNGSRHVTVESEEGASSVRFELALEKGRNTLQGWFSDAAGRDLAGAYYGRISAM